MDHPDNGKLALFKTESRGRFGEVEQEELEAEGEEDGADSFDQVQPSPSPDSCHTLHVSGDQPGQEPAYRPGADGRREEDGESLSCIQTIRQDPVTMFGIKL
jgi:hypothetical protein